MTIRLSARGLTAANGDAELTQTTLGGFDVATLAPHVREGEYAQIHAVIPTMEEEELQRCYEAAVGVQRSAWLVQAHAFHEANKRRGENKSAVAELYRKWDVSQQVAGRLIAIWELLSPTLHSVPDELPLPRSFYHAVVQTDNPAHWLEVAEREKASDPSFTIRALRAMIADAKRTRDEEQRARQTGRAADTVATAPPPLEAEYREEAHEEEPTAEEPVSALVAPPTAVEVEMAEAVLDSDAQRQQLIGTSVLRVRSAHDALRVTIQQLQRLADPAHVAALFGDRERRDWAHRVEELRAMLTYCAAIDREGATDVDLG